MRSVNFDNYRNHFPDSSTDTEVRAAYRAEAARTYALFVKDTLADLGLTDHPKAAVLMALAWAKGVSSGYRGVYSEAVKMAEDWDDAETSEVDS